MLVLRQSNIFLVFFNYYGVINERENNNLWYQKQICIILLKFVLTTFNLPLIILL